MRASIIVGCALAMSILPVGAASAQFASPEVVVTSSSLRTITCREFEQLSGARQLAIVNRAEQLAPTQSLSPLTRTSRRGSDRTQETPPLQPQLSAGLLIAACQGRPDGTTLAEAYSYSRPAGRNGRF